MEQFVFSPDGDKDCTVTAWLQPELSECPSRLHPAIVICPGGAYAFVSQREGEPVAKKYFAAGYGTFVLTYSVMEHAKNFKPLRQLAATVSHIRNNPDAFHVAPDQIAVCGFSAGGHLAASLGVLYNDKTFLNAFPQNANIRPDAMVLGYPVITADEFTHRDTLSNISGITQSESLEYKYWGLNDHVDAQTPPTFLWHTATDGGVPAENSLKMALSLSKAKVPYELHVFPSGAHGMSVCNQEVNSYDPYNARWVEWSISWLNRMFEHKE